MARFERSSERRGNTDFKMGPPKRGGRRSSNDGPRGRRPSGRDSDRRGRGGRGDFQLTKVTCASCGAKCEVPFKPTSDKPVYCKDCFTKKDKVGSDKHSNEDLEIINEKLDKIMSALGVD